MPEIALLTGAEAVAEGTALPGGRRPLNPVRLARLAEAQDLVGRVFAGDRRAMIDFAEAMSTSDFPILFGELMDRELMASYADLPQVWSEFARRTTVRDFRPKKWVDLLGGRAALSPVPELTEYPARSVSEAEYEFTVGKFGDRIPLSWEMVVNDDLDAFRDLPNRLGQAARDTEDITATRLLVGAAGPDADFFSAGNDNILDGNPALSETAVEAALTTIGSRRDSDNRPIFVSAAVLMVPPALQVAAERIVGATEVRQTIDGITVVRTNPLAGRVRVVVNPWLPVIDETANVDTTWYLLPAPNTPRPAVVLGFLRGHETPDLRVKADTGQRVGGGQVDAQEGSFDFDDIQYRVRHVLGGTVIDPITTAVSNGSGV